ncbi:MAG: hypothetical protein H7Y41_04025 [Hyphomonadaceae bacterium]|nr:hypothetical protein [Clostridia bacterium]
MSVVAVDMLRASPAVNGYNAKTLSVTKPAKTNPQKEYKRQSKIGVVEQPLQFFKSVIT